MNEPAWMPEKPYKLKGIGFTDPFEPRVLLERGFNEGYRKTAKAILEWLMGTCPHGRGDFRDADEPVTQCFHHACGQCMQQFKEEIERL